MNFGTKISRIGQGLPLDTGRIGVCIRKVSTNFEQKYLQDVLQRTTRSPTPSQCAVSSRGNPTKDASPNAHKDKEMTLDFTPRDILNLKSDMRLLDSCQTGLSATSSISSRWRQLDGATDPQKNLETKLCQINGKSDTLLYSVSHDHIWQLVTQRLLGEDAAIFRMHGGKEELSSARTHRVGNVPPKQQLHVDKRDYCGLQELLSRNKATNKIIQTSGDSSAKSTLDHISSIQNIVGRTNSLHVFRDNHELSITSHLLEEGCRMSKELSSPSMIQSSLGLISPCFEVRYISGPWAVVNWLRQLLERHRINANIPNHAVQPILHTLSAPHHARVQLYRCLNNAIHLRRQLVELPCTVSGDALTSVIGVEDKDALSVIMSCLQERSIGVAVSPNRTNDSTDISITCHANHSEADIGRVVAALTSAYKTHAQSQQCM